MSRRGGVQPARGAPLARYVLAKQWAERLARSFRAMPSKNGARPGFRDLNLLGMQTPLELRANRESRTGIRPGVATIAAIVGHSRGDSSPVFWMRALRGLLATQLAVA